MTASPAHRPARRTPYNLAKHPRERRIDETRRIGAVPRQAVHTLESARSDRAQGFFDWACFKAHQAAELAAKGYVRATLHYATGHSIVKLLASIAQATPAALVDCAKALDKVYIPARYPDAFDAGAPLDYYTAADADASIECAQRILDWFNALASR